MKRARIDRGWFNSLSLRFIAGTTFLTLTSVLLCGALAGSFISRNLKTQLTTQNEQQAQYLMRTVEIGVLTRCFSEISSLRLNGKSKISKPDQQDAMGNQGFQYGAVGELSSFLKERVAVSDRLLHSISVYYRTPNVLLSTLEGIAFLNEPSSKRPCDTEWLNLYEPMESGQFGIRILPARDYPGGQNKVLSMVVPLSVSNPDILICLNVDGEYLDSLLSQSAMERSPKVSLWDISRDQQLYEYQGPEGAFGKSGELIRSYADSSYLSWRCVLLSEPPGLFEDISFTTLLYLAIALAVLVVAAGVFLSIKMTYKTSRSIAQTAALLTGGEGAGERYLSVDDAVSRIKREAVSQHAYITQSRLLVKNNYLLSLLEGKAPEGKSREEVVGFLKLSLPYKYFTCFVFCYRLFSGEVSDEALHDVWEAFRARYEPDPVRLEFCRTEGKVVALIVNYDQEEFSCRDLSENLNDALESLFDLRIHCGVGSSGSSADNLPVLYSQALSALRYSALYPHRLLFSYGETSLWDQNQWNRERFADFCGCLSRQDGTGCTEILSFFCSCVEEKKLSYTAYREIVDAVLREVETFASQNLIDLRDLFVSPLADQFASLNDREQVFAELSGVLSRIFQYTDSNNVNRNTVYIRKTIAYIRENYQKDLSIQDIADAQGLSRYYLSRLFKEATDTTLLNYLTDVRMKEAKRLLEQSAGSVGEIAEQVGFHSPSYFDKKFKQTFGCSPASLVGAGEEEKG